MKIDVTTAVKFFVTPRRRQPDDEEALLLASATHRVIEDQGDQLAVWSWGEGPRILLVHGWEGYGAQLGGFVPGLLANGFQVIAMDAPAHGRSAGRHSSVLAFGRAILAVANAIGPLHGLIAHSVGSAAALFAFQNGLEVAASVHLAGPSSLMRAAERFAAAMSLAGADAESFKASAAQHLGAPLDSLDLEKLRGGMRHPALLLHDPEDPMVPFAESEELARAWPEANLIVVSGVGHQEILRAPQVIDEGVHFLAQRKPYPTSGGFTRELEAIP